MPPSAPFLDIRPHSLEAERTTLGALLQEPDRLFEVAAVLKPGDFYDPALRAIFEAMCRLHEERSPVDVVTVADALRGNAQVQQIGGAAFLAELAANVPLASHAARYAAIVRERALRRQLLTIADDIQATARDDGNTAIEALEETERKLLAVSRQSSESKPQHIAEIGAASYERYSQLQDAKDKAAFFGLTTGFAKLDELLTGLQPGTLTTIAARPSVGKSSMALDIARHAASALGKNVAVFSLEMTKQEIMDRIIAGFLGVETWKLKKGCLTDADFRRMGSLFDQLKAHPLYIDDDPDTSLSNLRSKARRQQLEHGLDLLVIDYLQLIEVTDRAAGENRTQQVSHISRSLKNLARELGCPIVALSQLSRSVEQRSPPIPVLSDLRDSGGIEQDSDVVLMLYRQSVYDEDCEEPNATDVYVRKNRHGPTGRVTLTFQPERMSFRGEEK